MPRAEYTPSMVNLRRATVDKINRILDQLADDPQPHGEHYSDRLKTLLDLYFGTVPATYRGEPAERKEPRS